MKVFIRQTENGETRTIDNVRHASIYPHRDEDAEAVLIVYFNDDSVSPERFPVADLFAFSLTA